MLGPWVRVPAGSQLLTGSSKTRTFFVCWSPCLPAGRRWGENFIPPFRIRKKFYNDRHFSDQIIHFNIKLAGSPSGITIVSRRGVIPRRFHLMEPLPAGRRWDEKFILPLATKILVLSSFPTSSLIQFCLIT